MNWEIILPVIGLVGPTLLIVGLGGRRITLTGPLAACVLFLAMESPAQARIRAPDMDELVGSADLIVVGKVQSVERTPSELQWLAVRAVLAVAGIVAAAILLWRRKLADAAVVAAFCLVLVLLCEPSCSTPRKVAHVSVSSTIHGTPPTGDLPVFFKDNFACDMTDFVEGEECLLFLKSLPGGYAMSWHHWSRWAVKDGQVQTHGKPWGEREAITVAEAAAVIQERRTKQGNDAVKGVASPAK